MLYEKGKWMRLLAVLAVALMVLAACQRGTTPGADDEDEGEVITIADGEGIKIAVVQVISGDNASLGTDQVRSIEIAVDDRGGELLNHPIELQVEDEGCSNAGGQAAVQKVLADPQFVGILGTSCSGAAVPASEAMSEAGLVMISGSNTSPFLTKIGGEEGTDRHEGYFRTAHNDEIQGTAAANFAYTELDKTKAASIHDGDPYTQGLAGVFDEAFKAAGGEITIATAVDKAQEDMRPVLTEIAASGAELIFFPIFQPAGDFIVKQAKEIPGLRNTILMGADGLLSDTFVVIPETEGMYFSGPATPTGPAYEELVAKYEAKFGEKPIQSFHAHAYDAANILFDAIEEVAEEQDDGSLRISRNRLREAVGATSGYEGLTGTLTCDEFGDCADAKIDVVQNTARQTTISEVRANVLFTYDPSS